MVRTYYTESPTDGDHDLYDVLAGRPAPGEAVEYRGLHVFRVAGTKFNIVPDGYAEPYARLDVAEMEDVLEVVATLNKVALEVDEHRANNRERLREQCGKVRVTAEGRHIVWSTDENGDPDEVTSLPDVPANTEEASG